MSESITNQERSFTNYIVVKSVILKNYKGTSLDIENLVSNIDIFESIYNSTITGYIDIVDSNDLIQFFPLIGDETIEFEFLLSENSDEFISFGEFRIYKISNREIRNDKVQVYRLWFTSFETITNIENRVSKSYNEKEVYKIISDLFKNLKSSKQLETEKTSGIISFISPTLHPLEAINYLASSKSVLDNNADFVFFESLDQESKSTKFYFKSLNKLLQQDNEPITTLKYIQKNYNTNEFTYITAPEDIIFKKGFDVIESKMMGLYSQNIIHYDPLRKRYEVQKINYDDYTFNKKENNKIFSDNEKDNFNEFYRFVLSADFPSRISNNKNKDNSRNKGSSQKKKRNDIGYINENDRQISNDMISTVLSKRAILLQEFENNKIYINGISGSFNYNVGKVINFEKPHIVNNRNHYIEEYGTNFDLFISGRYLITKAHHSISKDSNNYTFKTYMEISKNSFKNNLKVL